MPPIFPSLFNIFPRRIIALVRFILRHFAFPDSPTHFFSPHRSPLYFERLITSFVVLPFTPYSSPIGFQYSVLSQFYPKESTSTSSCSPGGSAPGLLPEGSCSTAPLLAMIQSSWFGAIFSRASFPVLFLSLPPPDGSRFSPRTRVRLFPHQVFLTLTSFALSCLPVFLIL